MQATKGRPQIWPRQGVPLATSRRARDRIMGVIAPVKPTGGAIGIATVVAFAGAAACASSSRSTCPSVRDPRVTERCVPSRLDSCIGDDPARRRGARPRSPGDASGLRAHRFRARCLYWGLPHLVASLARRPRTGASTLNGAKTQHAREPVGTKRPARIFPSLRGNADQKR